MNRRVEGSYTNVEDAMNAVRRLHDEGYGRDEISIVANPSVRDTIPFTMDAEVTSDTDVADTGDQDDRSLWEKIKDAFTVDDYDATRYDDPDYDNNADPLYEYRDDIERGNIVVLVNADNTATVGDNFTTMTEREDSLDHPGGITEPGMFTTPDLADTTNPDIVDDPLLADRARQVDDVTHRDTSMDTTDHTMIHEDNSKLRGDSLREDDTLELREEHLDVNTQEVQTGDVRIHKDVVEETETVDVPVSHEEVTIERRPVTDHHTTDEPISNTDRTEEIVIPITEEQVDVNKHTEVVEEVVIRKDKVTEEKRVSDTVRKEELDIESDGDVHIDSEDNDVNRRP